MTLVAPQIRTSRSPRAVAGVAGALRRPRLATVLTGAGLALVPWMVVLARTLPQTTQVSNWSTAWVGLDALLAVGLTGTGVLLRRNDPRAAQVAAATAAVLLVDAWFDVTTAAPGKELATALTLALTAELPMAVTCAVVALRKP
ncbi:hypothetical protein GCM10010331_08010 [Streptomyces xanthochromogenes]|uniref:hypothetical protein n=1 Tax=Streptomyces xanthochromogenes TaxID=67384 RepID=UPI0016759E0B|nr:hypothetical protein [Streptomyces xanthochromogenes]GHB24434.1 hypothetical protein GCM10010331_08010 [Streptomyces xanthochromogenes]